MEHPPHFEAEPKSDDDKNVTKKKQRVILPAGLVPEVERPAPVPEPEKIEKPTEQSAPSLVPKIETLVAPKSEQKETASDAETDKALETLDVEERQQAAQEYVATLLPEVAAEAAQAEPEKPAAVESAADAAFLHELQNRLPIAETPEQAVDEAYATVAETLGGESEAETEQTTTSEPEALAAELTSEESAEEPEDDSTSVTPPPTTPPQAVSPKLAASASPGIPARSTGGGGVPPIARPPAGDGRAFMPLPGGGANTLRSVAANTTAGMLTADEAFRRERSARASGLIVGGLLGYLMGRRRGRIKTERKLLPVQEKLKKEVTTLHENIAQKEEQIRTLAAQKAETASVLYKNQDTIKKLHENHIQPKPAETTAATAIAAREIARPKSATSSEIPAPAITTEQITPAASSEVTTKQVEQMAMPQLLVVAENIKVDNVSVRRMYETRQLDEQSVRRIVQEQVRGGNAHEAVARELIAKESPFEKDPFTRPPRAAGLQSSAGAAETTAYRTADSDTLPNPLVPTITMPAQARPKAHRAGVNQHTATVGIGVIIVIALALAIGAMFI